MCKNNTCYTYFKIVGDFNPNTITKILNLTPSRHWSIGDLRKNGSSYDFALWEYGRCSEYDVLVENQMMKTINDLIPKVKDLKEIRQKYDVEYTIQIVPSVYVGEPTPCLSPNRKIIEFCYVTETELDIDLYVYGSEYSK